MCQCMVSGFDTSSDRFELELRDNVSIHNRSQVSVPIVCGVVMVETFWMLTWQLLEELLKSRKMAKYIWDSALVLLPSTLWTRKTGQGTFQLIVQILGIKRYENLALVKELFSLCANLLVPLLEDKIWTKLFSK